MVFGNTPRPFIPRSRNLPLSCMEWGGKIVNYASDLNDVDLRFLDGEFLENSLTKLFPEKKSIYYVSGYSKLDSYFNSQKKIG